MSHYVGTLLRPSEDDKFEEKVMRCSTKDPNNFLFPDEDDVCDVPVEDKNVCVSM